jgi:hypothetical protein
MDNAFDNLARKIASGISRRDALRLIGSSVSALLLSSIGIRRALGAITSNDEAVTCGTCQKCDLDTNTCGLPCSPASAGQTLCDNANQDGSYLRLTNYLINQGFVAEDGSNSVIFHRNGRLFQSVLGTNFQNPNTPGETAMLGYSVSPLGGISVLAVIYLDGVQSYSLGVDYDGRIVQTVATQTTSSSSASSPLASAEKSEQVPPDTSNPITSDGVEIVPNITPGTCDTLVNIFCGLVFVGDVGCFFAIAALCPEAGPGAIPCALTLGALCAAGTDFVCKELGKKLCRCPMNQQLCNGICCDTCMDCVNNVCHPNVLCSEQGELCCNNVCCQVGFTCVNGQCTNPYPGCYGATCETYMECNDNPDCFCGTLADGSTLCQVSTACAPLTLCPDGTCPSGSVCLIGSCCGEPVCVPLSVTCPSSNSSSSAQALGRAPGSSAITGPTTGHR